MIRNRAPRRGLSLVEVVVALVVFSIAMVGLELAMLTIVRSTRLAREEARAAEVAARRYEMLAGQPCGAPTSGEDRSGDMSVAWSASPFGAHALATSQVATFRGVRGVRTLRFDGAVPCR